MNSSTINANGTTESNDSLLHKKERPQEASGFLLLILLVALIGTQLLVLWWKKNHFRSYHTFTLFGLFLVPFGLGFAMGNIRFLVIWCIYTAGVVYLVSLCMKRPLDHRTPRFVYKFFAIAYKITYTIGAIGYVIMMIEFLGFGPINETGISIFEFGLYLLFYGLYFGLLSRDVVQECSDRMAAALGYYNPDGIPMKHLRDHVCAICGDSVGAASSSTSGSSYYQERGSLLQAASMEERRLAGGGGGKDDLTASFEETIVLDCKHEFHEFCIRGWCIIGKKDMCPYCKENIDMKLIRKNNPWDTQEQFYLSLLDGIRYFLVFQPIVIMAVQGFGHLFGLDRGMKSAAAGAH